MFFHRKHNRASRTHVSIVRQTHGPLDLVTFNHPICMSSSHPHPHSAYVPIRMVHTVFTPCTIAHGKLNAHENDHAQSPINAYFNLLPTRFTQASILASVSYFTCECSFTAGSHFARTGPGYGWCRPSAFHSPTKCCCFCQLYFERQPE